MAVFVRPKFEVQWNGTDWVDESDYLLDYWIKIGMSTHTYSFVEPCADVGLARFELTNHDGRFDFGGGVLSAEVVGVRVRAQLLYLDESDFGDQMFYGFVERIEVASGKHNYRALTIHCVDLIQRLKRTPALVAYEPTKSVVDGLEQLINLAFDGSESYLVDDYPDSEDIRDWGKSWFHYTSVWDAIRDICRSRNGRFIQSPDGTLFYLSSLHRQHLQNPTVTTSETFLGGEYIVDKRLVIGDQILNALEMVIHPPNFIGSDAILWALKDDIRINQGATLNLSCRYVDVDTGEFVAAYDVASSVADVDYILVNGSGVAVTTDPNVTVGYVDYINRRDFTITNNLNRPIFLTFLEISGKPMTIYEDVLLADEDTSSITSYGRRFLQLALNAQHDTGWVENYMSVLLNDYGTPFYFANQVVARKFIDLSERGWGFDVLQRKVYGVFDTDASLPYTSSQGALCRVAEYWYNKEDGTHWGRFDFEYLRRTAYFILDVSELDEGILGL